MIRGYPLLSRVPDAGLLDRYLDTLGVIVPLARTNLVTNPSLELSDTSPMWTTRGTTINAARTTAHSFHGAYSYAVTPSTAATQAAMNGAGGWGSIVPLASTFYAVSAKARGALGVPYVLYVENSTGSVTMARRAFVGTGRWQWVWLVYQEAGVIVGSRNYFVGKDNSRDGSDFYIDGLQVEAITDGYYVPTTYLDGDQVGLVPNQFPAPYGWNGAPHASTSYRISQTRAGGRIVRFRELGFLLTAILGLGLAPPAHQALTFAQLDGGQYENTLKPPRVFSLAGRAGAATPNGMDSGLSGLSRLLDRDLVAQRQPLVLTVQAQDCGVDCGEMIQVPALYQSGFEGNVQESPTAQIPVTFTQYIPFVTGHDQGVALTTNMSVSNANDILRRSPGGVWSALGTGASGGAVQSIVIGLDGKVYAAGLFTSMGGVANTSRIAYWDPSDSAWHAMGTGANGTVQHLAVGPDGSIYAVGAFTSMGGVANTARIAKWNGSAWSALGTGITTAASTAYAVAVASNGDVYATGDFTAPATRIAKWDGSTWSGLGTGLNDLGDTLVFDAGGNLYVGGDFTTANGVSASKVAKWNGTTFVALAAGLNASVIGLALGANGILYATGIFTNTGYPNIAQWNGIAWSAVGGGLNNNAYGVLAGQNGLLYVGGIFTASDAITFPDSFAVWNGATFLAMDVDLPASSNVRTIAQANDGTLYIGYNQTGTATAAAITTAPNDGTVEVYPTLIIRGPSSGTSRIYELINTTTGAAIFFNLTLSAGETATLTLNPKNVTFVSTFQGNILNTILPGSNTTGFVLQPGSNTISFFAASSTVTATLRWQIGYNNLNDALYQAVAP